MSLLQYLKKLRLYEEVIDTCIPETIHKVTKMQVKDVRNWPDWREISSYCSGKNNISSFIYVPWVERFISYGHTLCSHEVLSNRFSGCYLACYKTEYGFYTCHIHTGDNEKKHAWNEFAKDHVDESTCIIFRPCCITDFQFYIDSINPNSALKKKYPQGTYDTWGIISPASKECLSVCICTDQNYIGSYYDPQYQSDVYKVKSLKNYPLKGKLILRPDGIPY